MSVGHLRNYIPTDVLCRMKTMQGFNVLHPMGWDAFGLPAENEAISRQTKPGPMVREYADVYKRQMNLVGIGYDWDRELNSSDPSYYRWTQWIFLLLYERGLAYHGDYPANWCPVDKTVLANEEVEGGLCWRCGTPVEKKVLKQWFFRITEYAQRLIDDLDTIDWPEGIKMMQRNWIGRSDGVEFDWDVIEHPGAKFRVFTTRIDTVYGATFCVLAPEHPLVQTITTPQQKPEVDAYIARSKLLSETDRLATGREKTGVFTGAHAQNPFTKQPVPIFVADYVLMDYGTGAIMAVPAHDERDYDFAVRYDLPIVQVIKPSSGETPTLPFTLEDGELVSSGAHSGLRCADAKKKMAQELQAEGRGASRVNYRLRDWLISRQRYWGCPIPIVHCETCGIVPVPKDELPVLLPDVDHYQPTNTGESPLAGIEQFVLTSCPKCKGVAKRETDTMGGFACSSWYFFRFCDPHNAHAPFDSNLVKYWMPVDCYVGGAEHAVMHLLYARFWTKVLFDAGMVPFNEPFQVLRNQGALLASTPYRKPRENETLKTGEEGIQISFEEAKALPADQVFWRWARMSKSKGNVVTPDEGVARYGADALRVYELFEAPFEQTIQWSDERVMGAVRFLSRTFKLASEIRPSYDPDWRTAVQSAKLEKADRDMRCLTHNTILKLTDDIASFKFNTAVAAMMEFLNGIADYAKRSPNTAVISEAIETFILLLSPIAPHTADELWEMFGKEGFTLRQEWPAADDALLRSDTVTIVLQVNGKTRGNIEAPAGAERTHLEQLALNHEKVRQHVGQSAVKKVIVVPDKLVNVVAE